MAELVGNVTYVCEALQSFQIGGPWKHLFIQPLQSPSSLFLLQLSAISFISQLIEACLKPLGQSTIVSHIFGGIVLGPSFLGQREEIARKLFPQRGNIVLETFASFGLMFFLFIMGVKVDVAVMMQPGRQARLVGLSVFIFTLILPVSFVYILKYSFPMPPKLANSLLFVALSQNLIGSPVIACLLTELKLLNTDVGRLALSSSMFSDVMGIFVAVVCIAIVENKNGNMQNTIIALTSSFALLGAIVYFIKPAMIWMRNRIKDEKSVDEMCIFIIFVFVLSTGFLSEMIGQHYFFGPLILGLAVPDGPPLGSTIVARVETLALRLFYPTFLAVNGLQTNIFTIELQASWTTGVVVLFSCLVKIGAVMLPAKYTNLPHHDAFVLGLILNARGFLQLIFFNFWKHDEVLSDEGFSVSVVSMVVTTAIITPLIKMLYDPSKQYFSFARRTIQHSKPDSEFRVLVCIHHHESIPTIINLLEVSHASKESPLAVIALILIELVARSNPILIAHQPDHILQRNTSTSNQILNALRQYEHHHEGYATVEAFTSISPYDLMHEDICKVAFDKKAAVVILPFHKQWAIDGSIGTVNRSIRNMNLQILERAPCSIGILIDRGILSKQASVLTTRAPYHVAVLFIGGPDDAESLAYGARMAKHHVVDLTVVQFLIFGDENSKDRKRDSELINEYRRANIGNEHFVVVEEVVRDGVGLAASIRGMEDCFDLIIVGRHHEQSQVLTGLHQWSECPELGVVGDMLASPDFGSTATVLVLQQQRLGARLVGKSMQRMANKSIVHDALDGCASPRSWSVTMDT